MHSHKLVCPHCGNETILKVEFEIQRTVWIVSQEHFDDKWPFDLYYKLTQCSTCENIALYYNTEADNNWNDLQEAVLVYPVNKHFGKEVPLKIRKNYEEAQRVKHVSIISFAVMLRRGVEMLCIDQKVAGGSLYDQIDKLAAQNVIPDRLAKMAHAIRFLGNQGAHVTDYAIDQTEIDIMDELFTALLEYVYVAPSKLEKLNTLIQDKRKSNGS